MAIFMVQLRFISERNAERLAARPKHREYLATLHADGKLLDAGPFVDDTGALLLYDVADEAELRAVQDADPYPANTYEVVQVREWKPLFGPQ